MNSGTPSILQRQPAAAAGGITAAVGAILLAFWAVAADAGWLTVLQEGTILLVNNAILIVVGLLAAWWAQRRSTPTAAPKLQEGTVAEVTNASGATVGHVEVQADAQAAPPA